MSLLNRTFEKEMSNPVYNYIQGNVRVVVWGSVVLVVSVLYSVISCALVAHFVSLFSSLVPYLRSFRVYRLFSMALSSLSSH